MQQPKECTQQWIAQISGLLVKDPDHLPLKGQGCVQDAIDFVKGQVVSNRSGGCIQRHQLDLLSQQKKKDSKGGKQLYSASQTS